MKKEEILEVLNGWDLSVIGNDDTELKDELANEILANQKEECKSAEEFFKTTNLAKYKHKRQWTTETMFQFAEEYAKTQQPKQEVDLERINKYGRHQFNRGAMNVDLINFEDWIDTETQQPKQVSEIHICKNCGRVKHFYFGRFYCPYCEDVFMDNL